MHCFLHTQLKTRLKSITLFMSFIGKVYAQKDTFVAQLSPDFLWKVPTILGLVLLGGIFAGLTLGLMGLDQTNLHVMKDSGTDKERLNATQVLKLLSHGKHWVLVTLLLANVIVNETLPIVLDSVLGGSWQAVLISTGLIVIFGEIIPQSICARHGLAIGARCSFMVLVIMYCMYPVAYPIALVLDYFLGESHGTVYKKAGLKSLVSLHRSCEDDMDGLTEEEVHIIESVLDLREKPISAVMTPIQDVFALSENTILDKKTVDIIMRAGYSRIPIHATDNPTDFISMLLVKRLITYDANDTICAGQFCPSALPKVAAFASCFEVLNFFQQGKSHMALVLDSNDSKGENIGVVTLEDIIEELIGKEIIDETDVYVNVHKKIKVSRRRITTSATKPGPLHTVFKT
ncbi:hypothetical protein BDF14DRAFT_1777964 [Spinellus fusiger]|nr:hypothetical protein BDF14DRAFT_1777964 [Spinellus fusiger]